MSQNHYDVIIIGAGAAGLMCAQLSGAKGLKTLLIDHSSRLGEKIRISGGGRCNFTNLNAHPDKYLSQNPNFTRSALARYQPTDFCQLLDKHDISYHEKTLGQLFCDNSAEDIINLLDKLCRQHKVKRIMETTILQVTQLASAYTIITSRGEFSTAKLVIATGGLSIPQIGASAFGYEIAKQFAINIIPPTPALVPLTLQPEDLQHFSPLAGISFDGEVSVNKVSFRENCLFTHRGLSGPAILQISSYWHPGEPIRLNLLPDLAINEELAGVRSSNKQLSNFLRGYFSGRLADSLCRILGHDKSLSQLSKVDIRNLTELVHNFRVIPSGTTGYKKAEVTRGGVDTRELDSKTMMAKNVANLYFIGEVVDVTGQLGGYNFHWAWASAHAAAESL